MNNISKIIEIYNPSILIDGCRQLKIALSDEQIAQFICYYEMLIEKNKVMNLTAVTQWEDVQEEVNIEIKYEGYISRQAKQVQQFARTERMKIPEDLDYDLVPSLRNEARQKLKEIRPSSIGQASRIMGVNPADVSVLLIYLKR